MKPGLRLLDGKATKDAKPDEPRRSRSVQPRRSRRSRRFPGFFLRELRSLIEIEWSTCVAHPTQSRRRSPRGFHAENAEPRRRAETGHHSAAGGCRPPCGRHIDRAATRKHKRLLRTLPFLVPCCRPIDAARSAPTGGRRVSLLPAWPRPPASPPPKPLP